VTEPVHATLVSRRWIVAFVALVHLAIGFVGFSPASPVALQLADAAAGRGAMDRAVAQYDAIAHQHPSRRVRERAMWRAGMLLAVDLRDPEAARRRFRRLTLDERATRRAEAYEQIGRIFLDQEHRPAAAAESFADAWRVAPTSPDAAGRLVRAARAWADAGEVEQAERLWIRVGREYPELTATSLVARADLRLARDEATSALRLYRRAQELGDGDAATVARLGAAACLQRLGNLDEALAEVDAADLPEDVRAARTDRLRARVDEGAW
jgi:tetratricopeptide (TPR) repeat protein